MPTARAIGLIFTVCLLAAGSAEAQVERSGGTNPAIVQQYQQANAERAQLQADNNKLKLELDETKKQLDGLRREIASLKAGSGSAQAELQRAQASAQTYQKSFEDARAKLQELVDRFRETVATMRGIETERTQFRQQLEQSKAAFDQCAVRNYELYKVDEEVLNLYEHQGMASYLARSEPFTRIKRTQIENLADDYRERAEQLRVQKQKQGASSALGSGTDSLAGATNP